MFVDFDEVRVILKKSEYEVIFDNNIINYRIYNLPYKTINFNDTKKFFNNEEEFSRFLMTFYQGDFKEEIQSYLIQKNRYDKLNNIKGKN